MIGNARDCARCLHACSVSCCPSACNLKAIRVLDMDIDTLHTCMSPCAHDNLQHLAVAKHGRMFPLQVAVGCHSVHGVKVFCGQARSTGAFLVAKQWTHVYMCPLLNPQMPSDFTVYVSTAFPQRHTYIQPLLHTHMCSMPCHPTAQGPEPLNFYPVVMAQNLIQHRSRRKRLFDHQMQWTHATFSILMESGLHPMATAAQHNIPISQTQQMAAMIWP